MDCSLSNFGDHRLETLVGRHSSFKLYSLLGDYLTKLDNRQAAAELYFKAMRYTVTAPGIYYVVTCHTVIHQSTFLALKVYSKK